MTSECDCRRPHQTTSPIEGVSDCDYNAYIEATMSSETDGFVLWVVE